MHNLDEVRTNSNLGGDGAEESQPSGSCRYQMEIDMNSNSTHATVVRLIGSSKRVLELGCATGHMSCVLRDRDCQIVAIEMDTQAAERASAFCERIIIGDLDHMNLDRELGVDQFDVVVAADVLEHLKDPASVLRAVRRFLKPNGYVVVSVPNIAHLSVRLALLAGRFHYADTGLLDRTHLKFFTRESMEKLFDDADFAIGHFQRIESIPADPGKFDVPYDPTVLPAAALEALVRDPEATTYQFVVVAYPLSHPGLTFIQTRFRQLSHEAQDAGKEAATLRQQLKEAHDLNEATRAEVVGLNLRIEALGQEKETEIFELQRLKVEAEDRLTVAREEIGRKEQGTEELTALSQASEREAAELRTRFEEQKQCLAGLTAQVEVLSFREKDLREMLLEAHDQLMRRDEEIAVTLASANRSALPASVSPQLHGEYLQYQQLVQRIRERVRQSLPDGGKVLVISKGDDQLLGLAPSRGLHFPQREDGVYAGYYPADAAAAITHLEELRDRGAQYLLIPQSSLWWLDHYRALGVYLSEHYTRVIDESDLCVLFDLTKKDLQVGGRTRPAAPDATRRDFGVNISGHFRSEKGTGEGGRSTVRSLKAAGIPFLLNDFTDSSCENVDAEFTTFSDDNPYPINLIHTNADGLPGFVDWKTEKYFHGRYNIGYWAWELSRFPNRWQSSFSLIDEVWVPSTFVLDSVSRVSSVPVLAVPHSLSKLALATNCGRSFFGLPKDAFLFLFMFDFMSVFERKNPLALVEAFKKAFKLHEKASLIIKVAHSESSAPHWRALERAAKHANIKVINGVLSRAETNSLLNLCDCYVSLHRSEGFGLTMAEAMSLAKPVIATGYSGNMDYMTPTNSFLVKHRLVTLERDYEPYEKGGAWADPDLDHAAELMRLVYEKRKVSKDIGRQAQTDIQEKLGAATVGATIRERFAALAGLGKISVPESLLASRDPLAVTSAQQKPECLKLILQIQKLIRSATPPGATVVVISKGDDELLKLDGRQGWHFPRQQDGAYAGYYPSDSAAAIGHLEMLRAKGGQFLLIPRTALWWLDHYAEFRDYLENCYRKIKSDGNGVLYELARNGPRPKARVVHMPESTKRKVNGAARPDHAGAIA